MRSRTFFAISALAVLAIGLGVYGASHWVAPHVAALSEAVVRRSIPGESLEVEWSGIALTLDPPAVELSGVRAVWRGEPEAVLHSRRAVVRPDAESLEKGRFEPFEASFEGVRFELPAARSTDRLLALRRLEVRRTTSLPVDTAATTAPLALSGDGALDTGGTLRFEFRQASGRSSPAQLELHFAGVPASEWAVVIPQLRDASGTIAGRLDLEVAPRDAGTSIEGHFEIDATQAGLLVAEAYRKPAGDPATLTGQFTRSSQGRFELVNVHVSVRKATGEHR